MTNIGKHWKIKDTSKMKHAHKESCKCAFCKMKRKEPHTDNCGCYVCRSKRGENSGNNNGMFGRTGKAHLAFKDGLTPLQRKEKEAGRKKPEHCEVCGAFEREFKLGLCFDHDHKTGKFRGWLCSHCNHALGYARDNPELLRKLAEYLENICE